MVFSGMTTPSYPPARPWVSNGSTTLCENPLWDGSALYWTDIPTGRIHRKSWESDALPEVFEGGAQVGGFTFQRDGSLLLFRETDIAILRPGESPSVLLGFEDAGSTRFNDVIADPRGRVFAGTIGRNRESGGLFRVDTDGRITRVAGGTGCSNGLGFSPGLDFLYWACSTRRRIFRFPYDEASGKLGEAAVFFEAGEDDGTPDGLTLDREGNLYSVRWAARQHGLLVLDPQGKVIHRHPVAARATTSAVFCGPDLRSLAITAANLDDDPHRAADLFLMEPMPIAGRAEFRSAIGL